MGNIYLRRIIKGNYEFRKTWLSSPKEIIDSKKVPFENLKGKL